MHIIVCYLLLCDNLIVPLWQVLCEYETRGFEFLLQAFNTPDYLEDITGLTQLHKETEAAEVWYFTMSWITFLRLNFPEYFYSYTHVLCH
jgi:hypothetical protein